MFVRGASPSLCSSSGSSTCARISPAVKLRINPSCAVMQNWQSTAHPACVETQIVCRPSLGINTASTDAARSDFFFSAISVFSAPSVLILVFSVVPKSNKYRTDPSVETKRCFTTGKIIVASRANRSLSAAGKFVIDAKFSFLSAYSA